LRSPPDYPENLVASSLAYFVTSKFWFQVGFAALLTGCAHLSPLYQNPVAGPIRSIRTEDGYNLAFIEFGEQGSYQDPSQVKGAFDLVRYSRKPLVITYVHGWHNNAGSGDVGRFSNFLSRIAHTPLIHNQGFQVIGVYVGWRGETTDLPGVNELTFYSRKAAAERLASNFDCFDAISSISEAARRHHRKENQYTVLLGHSFGGLVVERAVAHAIDAEMHGRTQKQKSLPADLTLVLNPASDSILSRQVISALYRQRTENSRPLFVSITSVNDSATGSIFPMGTSLSALSKVFNRVSDPGPEHRVESERRYFTSTPGHNKVLVNHVAEKLEGHPLISRHGLTALEMNLSHNLVGDAFALDGANGELELWHLKRVSDIDVPYWNVQVDKRIIKNHGDIWNDRAEALMAGVFRIVNPMLNRHAKPPADLQKPPDFRRVQVKQ
jgi:hypothetical protein